MAWFYCQEWMIEHPPAGILPVPLKPLWRFAREDFKLQEEMTVISSTDISSRF